MLIVPGFGATVTEDDINYDDLIEPYVLPADGQLVSGPQIRYSVDSNPYRSYTSQYPYNISSSTDPTILMSYSSLPNSTSITNGNTIAFASGAGYFVVRYPISISSGFYALNCICSSALRFYYTGVFSGNSNRSFYNYPTSVIVRLVSSDNSYVNVGSAVMSGDSSVNVHNDNIYVPDNVTSIEYSFYYPAGSLSGGFGSTGYLQTYFFCNTSDLFTDGPSIYGSILQAMKFSLDSIYTDFKVLLEDILDKISSATGIGGWSPTPDNDAQASQFVEDVSGVRDQIDKDNAVIESLAPKPDTAEVVPKTPQEIVSGIVPDNDTSFEQGFEEGGKLLSNFLGSPVVLMVLLLSLSSAFVGYILFGRRD